MLVSLLGQHQEEDLRQLFGASEKGKEQLNLLPEFPEAFDSHCHLYRTLREFEVLTESLDEINSHNPMERNEIRNVGVVEVFCDP